MKAKVTFLFLAACLIFSGAVFSQQLTFCEKLDARGNPVNPGNTFTVNKNGSPISLCFVTPAGFTGTSVNFDIYRVDDGKEVFHSTMKQPVNSSQKSVVKEMTFYDAGKFRVYVFDEKDQQLAKAELTIKRAAK